jgi:hypothetical protein
MQDDERGKGCGTYGEKRDTYSVLVGKTEGRRYLEDLGVDGNIILKLVFKD